jgi:hypothetical protein
LRGFKSELNRGKRFVRLTLVIALLALLAGGEEKNRDAWRSSQALRLELELAKYPALYYLVDFSGHQILLKSRGMVLKEWRIESIRRWGDALSPMAFALEKKSSFFPPRRAKIKPGTDEEEGSFELDALELKDMPSSFVLYLSGGVRVYIRPKPRNLVSRIGGLVRFLAWNLWVPWKNLGHEMRGKPFAAIDLSFSSTEDAQSLYWSLADGTKGLILPNRQPSS